MANVQTFTKSGTKAAVAVKLDKTVFEDMPESHELVKLAYVTYLANGRQNLAQTKTRGEVSGGGKKPWKQKGTGRARFGSTRNPIWRGGGIAFGPTGIENYSKKLHVTAKRKAIRQALSMAANEGRIRVIEAFDVKDGKTANAAALLDKLQATKNVLLVVDTKTPVIERAVANLPYVKMVQATYVNVFDTVNADAIIITEDALRAISTWLGGTK